LKADISRNYKSRMLQHLHTLSGHKNPVYAISDGLDNHTFYTAGNDKGVVEWSLETMAFVKVLVPVKIFCLLPSGVV
jgi:WD40 repeat protein